MRHDIIIMMKLISCKRWFDYQCLSGGEMPKCQMIWQTKLSIFCVDLHYSMRIHVSAYLRIWDSGIATLLKHEGRMAREGRQGRVVLATTGLSLQRDSNVEITRGVCSPKNLYQYTRRTVTFQSRKTVVRAWNDAHFQIIFFHFLSEI